MVMAADIMAGPPVLDAEVRGRLRAPGEADYGTGMMS